MGPLLKELTDLGALQPKLLARRREQFEREGHILWGRIGGRRLSAMRPITGAGTSNLSD